MLPCHVSHVSAAEGYLDIVKFLLLQPGIDINARDENDATPLLGMRTIIHYNLVPARAK